MTHLKSRLLLQSQDVVKKDIIHSFTDKTFTTFFPVIIPEPTDLRTHQSKHIFRCFVIVSNFIFI